MKRGRTGTSIKSHDTHDVRISDITTRQLRNKITCVLPSKRKQELAERFCSSHHHVIVDEKYQAEHEVIPATGVNNDKCMDDNITFFSNNNAANTCNTLSSDKQRNTDANENCTH
jgi:hypothetical protein